MADPSETYDVARYRKEVMAALIAIKTHGREPLVVGGSGMYVRSLTRGLFEGPGGNRDSEVRKKWLAFGAKKGMNYLYHVLSRVDPASASRIAPADIRRVLRALEYFELTAKPISSVQTQWGSAAATADIVIGLNRPRATLHERCNQRVLRMMEQGFLDEVRRLREKLEVGETARQAVGYKEALAHLQGEISYDRMVTLMQQHTRQLAKRQLTWFRREHNLRWIEIEDSQTTSKSASLLEPLFRRS